MGFRETSSSGTKTAVRLGPVKLCSKGLFFKSPCFRTSRPPSLVCPPRGLKRTAAMAAREEIEQAILQTLQTAPIANSMEAAEAMKVDHEL